MEHLDSELIILEVQKYPCLYNIKHEDFKNRELKRDSWMSVPAAVLGEKWDEMGEESKTNVGKEVQKRWKSMKDSYVKSIKSQEGRSGDSAKSKKPYVFQKQMSFLQSVFQQRETSGNMKTVHVDDNSIETVRSEPSPVPVSGQKFSQSSKRRKTDNFEQEIVSVLKANLVQPTPNMPDPDEMFLLSQIQVIKQMKPSDKIDFQVKFMQLLQSYVTPSNNTPSTSSPYNTSTATSNPPPNSQHPSYTIHSSPSDLTSSLSPLENNVTCDEDSLISFFNL